MFGRKRKKLLFGENIELDCRYCRHNGAAQGESPLCTIKLEVKNGKCKKYAYDPLRREPRVAPLLRSSGFSKEDFKL